ncbi:MAG: homocysteine S-methyltransferase family protein [Tissierellia bacterium]|nr:homocysteine S-methyltransferase family protein [Tissierellia bacterium]
MIRDLLGKERLYYDGATGTYLRELGVDVDKGPERLNLSRPEALIRLHGEYLRAGAQIILAHTFGAHGLKYSEEEVHQLVRAAADNVREAMRRTGTLDGRHFVSLDLAPLGRMLEPLGDLSFEEAYRAFAVTVEAGVASGVDLITLETFSDPYEIKAALLAAKEKSDLPVFVTGVFDGEGRMLTGASVDEFLSLTEGLGADAVGINCSLGPRKMVPVVAELSKKTSLPLIVSPNAGIPQVVDGATVYTVGPEEFARYGAQFAHLGASILGGCCGSTPETIKELIEKTRQIPLPGPRLPRILASGYGRSISLGGVPLIIGERINPTGNEELKGDLREGRLDAVLRLAKEQEEAGAHILDVNCGFTGVREEEVLPRWVSEIQAISPLPLSLDTTNVRALAGALRIYNGRPIINSVSGKKESLKEVLPLAAKYGAVVVALLLDHGGIPEDSRGRLAIAEKILTAGAALGLSREQFLFDPLALTLSSEPNAALVALETLDGLRERGLYSVLGISNISFGLPQRDAINGHFLSMALSRGLTAAIVNPNVPETLAAYESALALLGHDVQGLSLSRKRAPRPKGGQGVPSLARAVEGGMASAAAAGAEELLQTQGPLEIIEGTLIPALDRVGVAYEEGRIFLPQLLMSAEAAGSAFQVLKRAMRKSPREGGGKLILATVEGDIHDIGKNIVKTLLENYGFKVLDLGRDVPPEKVLEAVEESGAQLVGLSALMTTTVPAMERTIALLKDRAPRVRVVVGGAVLDGPYAEKIGAHQYAPDAMATVRYAQKLEEEGLL